MAELRGAVSTPALHRAYNDDYAGWIEDTALAIEQGRFSEIDRAALAAEVRDLGKSERRELKSALEVLITHMLKTRYQPEKQTRSWALIIKVQRDDIADVLEESPSLRRELPALMEKAYRKARLRAADETGFEVEKFPELCEWTVAEVLTLQAD
jgi:hypothetical protein